MPHTGLVDKISTRFRRDTVQPSDINLAYEKLRDTFRTDEVHSKTVVNALIAAIGESLDAKRPEFPIATNDKINALTHGAGARGDAVNVSVSANQIRGSLVYLPEETTFTTIGLVQTGSPVVGGFIRLGVADYTFSTRTASNILDAGENTSDVVGEKTRPAATTRGPGWIILLAYFSMAMTIQGFNPSRGYNYNTAGSVFTTPVQTGSAYSPFGATEVMNTDSTALLSTWLVAA